jgi:tRNA-specific 2-thiouridylase
MKKSKRVLMAMSGGIDSSIAALLLHEKGYTVIGATFRTWDYISDSCLAKQTGCCSMDTIQEAKEFALTHGFEHHILDFRKRFKDIVIENFVNEYVSGQTPNPCVICNSEIKWGLMLETANELDCDYIATGHYAGIRSSGDSFVLVNATDIEKDQTYFLWRLSSKQLSRTLFPLYGLKKSEVKALANKYGFTSLANKRESQEICFIPNNDYRQFLVEEYPETINSIGEGIIIDSSGKTLGKHKGYMHYTIGQRKGLGIALGEPAYVTNIDSKSNIITVGKYEELKSKTMLVKDYVVNKFEIIPDEFDADVKIRYKTPKIQANISKKNDVLEVNFFETVHAITPGQSAVFYIGDELIGGGIIVS